MFQGAAAITCLKENIAGYNWGRALRLGWARGSSAASKKGWGTIATAGEITLLGCCHLGKILWEST